MSALKMTALARNVTRYAVFQPRNLNLIRQYATKIDQPKKTSALKLLLIGVIGIFNNLKRFMLLYIFLCRVSLVELSAPVIRLTKTSARKKLLVKNFKVKHSRKCLKCP